MIITIDGPVACGKTTIARMLAQDLGYFYIYSGLLYRAMAFVALSNQLDIDNPKDEIIAKLILQLDYLFQNGKEQLFFNKQDITSLLATPQIDDAASRISMHAYIRELINVWQRQLAINRDVIIDGRDSGSVVFPHADLKIYLQVPVEIRAQRWAFKQAQEDRTYSLQQALAEITKRDDRDSHRTLAPLVVPDGAAVLDNTISIATTLTQIKNYLNVITQHTKKAKKDLGFLNETF